MAETPGFEPGQFEPAEFETAIVATSPQTATVQMTITWHDATGAMLQMQLSGTLALTLTQL